MIDGVHTYDPVDYMSPQRRPRLMTCSGGSLQITMNLTIKAVKRRGRGFRNFSNYRLRLLLAAGVTWHTHQTTRIRGRHPRLIA